MELSHKDNELTVLFKTPNYNPLSISAKILQYIEENNIKHLIFDYKDIEEFNPSTVTCFSLIETKKPRVKIKVKNINMQGETLLKYYNLKHATKPVKII